MGSDTEGSKDSIVVSWAPQVYLRTTTTANWTRRRALPGSRLLVAGILPGGEILGM